MTFISIIIPFNHRKRYLEECLDSLMEQNIDDGEVILILNRNATQADKEPLDDLMEKYAKLNIKVKEFDNEIGVAKARNIGLELATGKYVYFIDADDYIYSNGLAKLIEVAKKTDADFINGHRLQTSYVKERFEEMLQNRNNETAKKGKKTDTEFSINLIVDQKSRSQENILTVLHALIKREIIIENNLEFDEEKEAYIDYPFILDLLQYTKTFKGVENALYGKRISDNPIDEPNLNQMIEERFPLFIQEYRDELDYINKHPNEENYIILKKEIKAKMLRYYIKRFSMQYRSNWDEKWTTSYLNEMSEIAKTFENIPWYYKKEINALKSKDKKALKKWINIRLGKNKAKQIIEISKYLCENEMPTTIEDLCKFNGVGRKTANLVMAKGFCEPAICVDVHVHRISNRLGYVKTKTPEDTEFALRKKLPKEYWLDINTLLVTFGQNICKPQKPNCEKCMICAFCDFYKNNKRN